MGQVVVDARKTRFGPRPQVLKSSADARRQAWVAVSVFENTRTLAAEVDKPRLTRERRTMALVSSYDRARLEREGRGDDDDLLKLPGLGRLLEASVFGGHGVVRSHFSACDGVSVTCSAAANPTIGEPMISN